MVKVRARDKWLSNKALDWENNSELNVIYAECLVCKLMRLLRLTPGLWGARAGVAHRVVISSDSVTSPVTTRPDTFCQRDHLSYLDASWSKPRANTSEILMSLSRWASTPHRAPPRRCHTGDTTGRGRPWCRHTGTLRTLNSGIFWILV